MHLVLAAKGFCIVLGQFCLQRNGIHALVDVQNWGYCLMFL